ncbi:MAG: decarboxylating NADP(+)-dependent phosphogluconate dehydrogenase [Candidatus Eremiobacteraeota bacterium]|nr:decarboxylating NADP(+)-dependent phosphogluconate dehydrogenase [Candidatus Eremiobacteraeota bacterium]
MSELADIGLYGLAVMGQNLVLNMNDHGFKVAVSNRSSGKVDAFLEQEAKGTPIVGFHELKDMIAAIRKPRVVMLMVKAGKPVDLTVEAMLPYLEPGDIIIDGGNSNYEDTNRRCKEMAEKGLLFIGAGVSGGEEGARHGPSIMPGGHKDAWERIKPILQGVAAKTESGEPCCDWVGEDGAGHFVKMVHNGIEYGDMQLICEAYDLMTNFLGMSAKECSEVFTEWNKGKLDSYLIEITKNILAYVDEDGEPLVDKILDTAGQKGTGKWTAVSALDQGIPLTLIGEAVFSRFLSALKDERVEASQKLGNEIKNVGAQKETFLGWLEDALYGAKLISYAQGYMLFRAAAKNFGWNLNYGGIALMWREGCIIRSRFLGDIKAAFDAEPELENLLFAPYFKEQIKKAEDGWRNVVSTAVRAGVAVPALSAALSFYDGYRRDRLPANLLQAQRDYFGAHTYERLDKPRGEFFHTDWTGEGGRVTSGTYNA